MGMPVQQAAPADAGGDYLMWATGVLVPIVLAAIPYLYKAWVARRRSKQ